MPVFERIHMSTAHAQAAASLTHREVTLGLQLLELERRRVELLLEAQTIQKERDDFFRDLSRAYEIPQGVEFTVHAETGEISTELSSHNCP